MLVKEFGVDYHLVLGMKVKTCVNSPYLNNNGWGKVGSGFPRIYVWIVTRSKEKNVTTVYSLQFTVYCLQFTVNCPFKVICLICYFLLQLGNIKI